MVIEYCVNGFVQEYDQVINERDILGTQLIRRNDELALLYEKLRIQDSALTRGEVHLCMHACMYVCMFVCRKSLS